MSMKTVQAHCEKCHNIVGEVFRDASGNESTRISIKIRGHRRRVYVVQNIQTVVCDWCGHEGKPLPVAVETCREAA